MKLFALFFLFVSTLFADVTYIYNKDVEGRESKTTWKLELKDDLLHIDGESLSGNTKIVTNPERITQSFSHESKNGQEEYSIRREGPTLIARKNVNGEKTERRFKVGNDLWLQEFDFSFKPFIHSNFRELSFSIIHPKKLDLHDMVATKQGFEPLNLNGELKETLRVKVTLTGFKKMFWHADLWFDPQAGDLLMYKANEGPNTPTSVITLFSKTIN
ncbi:MAG: hypothetical protein H7A38_06660 [Chlamydiales bacterium]|nr:hypothetical protein [Chlamydiales bacterium]